MTGIARNPAPCREKGCVAAFSPPALRNICPCSQRLSQVKGNSDTLGAHAKHTSSLHGVPSLRNAQYSQVCVLFVRALSVKTRIQGGERLSLKLKRFVFSHHSKTSGASRAKRRGLYRSKNGGCASVLGPPVPVFAISSSPSLALSLYP